MRRVAVSLAVVLGLAATPAAHADTTYYTLNAAPVGQGTEGFLTSDAYGGVTTSVYRSGSQYQQWTPVNLEYPNAVTLHGGPSTDWHCYIGICGYDEDKPLLEKFVNRGSGMCLTVLSTNGATRDMFAAKCGTEGRRMREQTWTWRFNGSETRAQTLPTRYTPLVQKIQNTYGCGQVKTISSTPGTGLKLAHCKATGSVDQSFRFLQVATVACSKYAVACGTTPRR